MGKIFQVMVLGFKGEKFAIDVAKEEKHFNEMTVLEFKKKLILKLPGHSGDTDELRLLFAKTQLEDADKFSDHQIKDKSTIMMVLRLPGGLESYKIETN
uniref:Ubiquitin-like protein n=1 Tax=Callorhinchus milii TaxID=7868 RepID=K4GA29_CALMI|nr:ubiquitin-like protein [Callorhinchus milii]AFM85466.1 ubiquitin-like protein [Callorhinchus milii]AFM85548.1 ubiquitin-like protein [Callorhinchus milii]AFM85575.1 ubiquitin-like protein [Callorhinchus milii]AFM85768.1 ubiquitin-like protein [Callorhinchus milii]